MGDDVVIGIGGDSGGAIAATEEAAAGLGGLQTAFIATAGAADDTNTALAGLSSAMAGSTSGATQLQTALAGTQEAATGVGGAQLTATDALNQMTAAMQLQHDTNVTLQDAVDTLGASYADQAAAFLGAASSADDYSARLGFLQAQIQLATDAQDEMNATMAEGGGAAGFLGDAFDGLTGMVTQAVATFGGMLILQTVIGLFQDASNAVSDFAQQMFQLNETVQQDQTSWNYLEGGGATGASLSQQLMTWTKTASMSMPYTRQDMLSAMTNMLTMPGGGMNNSQIEQYLPMLADIGATRAPGASLTDITNAIVDAEAGRSMRLRYDLHIDPSELAQYGLDVKGNKIENPSQLLPALAKWAAANGYSGAAAGISTSTWWGEWSSFMDRIQNFELSAGNSLFHQLQGDLTAIAAFWDAHQGDMNGLADMLSKLFGVGVTDTGQFLLALVQGMIGVGTNTAFMGFITAVEKWLSDPNLQAYYKGLGDVLGAILGFATNGALGGLEIFFGLMETWAKDLGDFLPRLKQPLDDVKTQLDDLGTSISKSLTPQELTVLKQFGGLLLELLASGVIEALVLGLEGLATALIGLNNVFTTVVGPVIHQFGLGLQWAGDMSNQINNDLSHLEQGFQQFTRPLQQANNETQQFAAILGELPNGLGLFQTSLGNVFNGLTKDGYTWGQDLADQFAKGILSGIEGISKAAQNAAAAARGPLHFSHPDYGPLVDFDEWPADMMRQYAAGMHANIGLVAAASRDAARAVTGPMAGVSAGASAAGASYVTHSSSATHTYDDHGVVSIHLPPMNEAAIEQIIHRVVGEQGGSTKRKLLAPGGYRRFGDIGFSGGRY